ncbi:hypothetical protein LTV02_19270 [Nocardia yamanashiensis]|uniref:hypothetical protein n=1 Tax=Nocardia yamanashiensis TaxID=209247 RepID=UPI001E2DF698|nr:hypothetical protein [Nocardia yamanashiensis]UGT45395.1 hypothetical protein LTV02_19270 [Nocardia yamanashiensis]
MTSSALRIHPYGGGLYGLLPPGAPTVLDGPATPGTMVLEVAGGHLTWNVLDGRLLPAAVIDDVDAAQDWVWAIYGEPIALALADAHPAENPTAPGVHLAVPGDHPAIPGGETATPALLPLAVSARRLAYAHWAARWWPASTLDGIAALDPALLDRDIAALTEECDPLVAGADAIAPEIAALIESFPRASDYALAAGSEPPHPDALTLARGTNGWDWRDCPPGLIDASERAVSWQLTRAAGANSVTVSVTAAPGTPAAVPAHLRPWARIIPAGSGNGNGTGGAQSGEQPRAAIESDETALRLSGDAWIGTIALHVPESIARVDIRVPGFGVFHDSGTPELRRRIRDFATTRLRLAGGIPADDAAADAPLLAEIAAAADDSDF